MTETPELSNEVWIATPVSLAQTTPPRRPVMVLGFHPRTKAQLHAYGPFTNKTELEAFLGEHKITLSYPIWENL